MVSLIDADILPYSVCFKGMKEGWSYDKLKEVIDEWFIAIVTGCNTTQYIAYLSGDNNFRSRIYPEYKANRKQPKPDYFYELRRYLRERWKCVTIDGAEADDALAMSQVKLDFMSAICSTDKDLKQIPGYHYNIKEHYLSTIGIEEAYRNLWMQVLTGDSTDNIKGIPRIGPKKAAEIVDNVLFTTVPEAVRRMYNDDDEFILNYRLVSLIQENSNFHLPKIREL